MIYPNITSLRSARLPIPVLIFVIVEIVSAMRARKFRFTVSDFVESAKKSSTIASKTALQLTFVYVCNTRC